MKTLRLHRLPVIHLGSQNTFSIGCIELLILYFSFIGLPSDTHISHAQSVMDGPSLAVDSFPYPREHRHGSISNDD
jgi:hypothetical protein